MTESIKVDDLEITPHPEGWLRPIHPALGIMDDTAYVGVWIPSLIKDKKGRESERPLLYIITDKGERVLANDGVLKSKGWRLQHKPILFENRWVLGDVESYLNGSEGQSLSPSELYNAVKKAWMTYIWFADQREYELQALWDIGTYFHTLFVAYPYPYFGGVKRSAKTKALTVHSCLDFNAIFSMNMSTASLFRLIQNAKCTVLIDENEKLSNPERAQEFRSIILAGYKAGQKVYRVEKNRKELLIPEAFEVYSPKALANIQGLEDVLEDRCKTTIMQRSIDRRFVDREIDERAQIWAALRAHLYRFFLAHWKEVRVCYDSLGEGSEGSEAVKVLRAHVPSVKDEDLAFLTSRELELWRPLFALAIFFDEKACHSVPTLHAQPAQPTLEHDKKDATPESPQPVQPSLLSQMLELAIDSAKVKQVESVTETGDMILVQVLSKLVKDDRYYPVKAIKAEMVGNWEEEQRWLTSEWIGRSLKRLGFTDKHRVGLGVEYLLKRSDIENLAGRMQVKIPQIDEGRPGDKAAGLLGTQLKMKVILRLVEDLEAQSGSANLDELMGMAEKGGIGGQEFYALIKAMLREGILYHPDERSMRALKRGGGS